MKTEQFLKLWKAVIYHSWIEELDHKVKGKLGFDAAFFPNVSESVWETVSRVNAEEKLFIPAQCLTKIPRNEAKIYQKRIFLALKDIF